MTSVTQYEIDWRTERLLKSDTPAGAGVFVMGLAKAGFVKQGGTNETWQLFTGDVGSDMGMPMPVSARAVRISASILSNTLSGAAVIRLMKNEADTPSELSIPAGTTGVISTVISETYPLGSRIMLHFIAGGLDTESIDIAGVSIAFEPI